MNLPKNAKVVNIPLSNIRLDFSHNFMREQDESTYDSPILRQDLATRGQITPGLFLEVGTADDGGPLVEPLQGNIRTFNIRKLAEAGVEDPSTCKTDDKGSVIPGTGKPFAYVKGVIVKGLSEREILELRADHGNVRGLNRAELQYFLEGLFNVGYGERDAARLAGGLLMQHYPPKRDIKPIDEDKGVDFLNNYRGVIQAAKNRWRSPKKLRDLSILVLKGKQSWPTKAEISEGLKKHEQDVDADKTGKVDRETTGQLFNAWFDKLVKAHTVTPEDGAEGSKGKAISMMNRTQIEDLVKVADSRFAKWMLYFVIRDERIVADNFPVVCKLLKKVEKGEVLTAEDSQIFDACWTSAEPVSTDAEVEAETEVEEAKVEEPIA